MGLSDMIRKTSMLRPLATKINPSQETRTRNKELKVLETRNDIDLMKLDREKKMFKGME